MIVQIYEIQTPQEAEKCIQRGVDHLGSVLLNKDEWRVPTLKEVFNLTEGTDAKNSLIPLFREGQVLFKALDYYRPDFVHFCTNPTDRQGHMAHVDQFAEYQARLREKFPQIGVMRSVPVPGKGVCPRFSATEIALSFEPFSDMLLIDTWLGKEPVEGFIGLTGKTSDWDVARDLVSRCRIPVVLGGGLSPTNVYEAVMKVRPAGADSCTETNLTGKDGRPIRFKKDFQKVAQFVKEVRRAESDLLSKGLTKALLI